MREPRTTVLERLATEVFDLLVIGAGIVGSRVAYEASRVGMRVALVDAGDFGGATSSASSKLVHGGLRYLGMGDHALVRESLQERHALMTAVAPHLVRRLRFVVPLYRGGPLPAGEVGAGVLAYAALSGRGETRPRYLSGRGARRWVPRLRTDRLWFCVSYVDGQTNDSRLVLATVIGAARMGAAALNHAPVVALEAAAGQIEATLEPALEGRRIRVRARRAVNAAGPWVDPVRRLEDPACEPIARLSKGVHLLLPGEPGWEAALTILVDESRVTFALPWEGMLLLGTTDTEYEGDPADVSVTPADTVQVLGEAALAAPADILRPERVRFSFAGLRVLPIGGGDTARAPREHLVATGPMRMVSVAGGKLTTHRRIAVDVLARIDDPRLARLEPALQPLPGAGPKPPRPAELDPITFDHLTHLYGAEAGELIADRDRFPKALERIHPDGPDVWAQAYRAIEREGAITAEDILRRRTTLSVRGLATAGVRLALAELAPGRR
ncbi:MAG: FAD-dependent oxidoreductase [Candidatus Dormibacteraceae bacterium]